MVVFLLLFLGRNYDLFVKDVCLCELNYIILLEKVRDIRSCFDSTFNIIDLFLKIRMRCNILRLISHSLYFNIFFILSLYVVMKLIKQKLKFSNLLITVTIKFQIWNLFICITILEGCVTQPL